MCMVDVVVGVSVGVGVGMSDESLVTHIHASCDIHDVDVCVSSPPGHGVLLV